MAGDHLDKETSVSVDITPTGVKAAAKSRFVASVDRLAGNVTELLNVRLEGDISRRRATIEGEQQLIKAAAKHGVKRLALDSEFADRAVENHFRQALGRQANKDGVLVEAIEDLRREPPGDSEANAGGEELSAEFMDRFESYAEGASTAELREKWGRVLASEVRKPGTFSRKVLRVVDELDPDVAQLFEQMNEHRIGTSLPSCLVGVLNYVQSTSLVGSGLIEDSAFGVQRQFFEAPLQSGETVWFVNFDPYALALPRDVPLTFGSILQAGENATLVVTEGVPGVPIHALTPVGRAISSILPDRQLSALQRLIAEMRKLTPNTFAYRKQEGGRFERFEL